MDRLRHDRMDICNLFVFCVICALQPDSQIYDRMAVLTLSDDLVLWIGQDLSADFVKFLTVEIIRPL